MDYSNKIVKYQIINSALYNQIRDYQRIESTWGQFVKKISEHKQITDKDKGKFIIPATFRTFEELLEGEDIGCTPWGQEYVIRDGKNVKDYYMLGCDYDTAETTIIDTINRFKEYEFILHTSWSHQKHKQDKGPCDRFRIYFLLEQPFFTTEMYIRTNSLLSMFSYIDKTSFYQSHGFYEPACHPNDYPESLYYHNKGIKLFNLFDLPIDLNKVDWDPNLDFEYHSEGLTPDMKQAILDWLPSIGEVDYDKWWKIGSAMVGAGYSEGDFCMVSDSIRDHREDRDSHKQWKSCKKKMGSWLHLKNILDKRFGKTWLPEEERERRREYMRQKEDEKTNMMLEKARLFKEK